MFVNTIVLNATRAPVTAATIFQSDAAELTRSLTLELKSGRNVVEISDISGGIHRDSPRISGAPGGVRVVDVVCKKKPSFNQDEPTAEIREITKKGIALNAERELRRQEAALLDDSARLITSGKGETREANASVGSDEILEFVGKYVQRKLAVQKTLQTLDEQIVELEKKLAMLRNARKGDSNAVITTTVVAGSDVKAELKLTYLVSGVMWRPFYDLHATTIDGQPSNDVSMRYCATIVQRTGEDWNDTTLTLSTADAQAQRQMSVPPLQPLKITVPVRYLSPLHRYFSHGIDHENQYGVTVIPPPRFGAQPPAVPQFGAQGGTMAFGSFGSHIPPAPSSAPIVITAPSESRRASTDSSQSRARRSPSPQRMTPPTFSSPGFSSRNSVSVAYRVEGTVSIPSDGEEHQLTVALLNFGAELNYVCVPRKSSAVYIVSKVINTSEYDLLPGAVNVYMNDSFVTRTSINFKSVNESFDCVLGVDTSIKVSYRQDEKTEHEPRRNFAEPQKTTTRTMITTVINRHNHDIPELIVRESVPLGSEADKVSVILRKPAGLAAAKDGQVILDRVEADDGEAAKAKVRWTDVVDGNGGEKDGLFEWIHAIPAGKKISFEAQWDIKSPSDVRWTEQTVFFKTAQ
ncbi:hypothetical protein PYCCODRAFT_1375112 [Trametes coccinea BRFM310]|uniref:DUF4139 domain-containing protein n=1 Tax=Trametes coccinea (strain BRFM310) TaxID=1353009 RepID=A0A1Y2IBK1_TRAC3|nr:hypothetical protein PYCCODRAFT_1375112 [Trametes coccinea BRFM310]